MNSALRGLFGWFADQKSMKLENNRLKNLHVLLGLVFGWSSVVISPPLLAQTPTTDQAVTPAADTEAQEKALRVLRQKMAELDGTAVSPAPTVEPKAAAPAGVNAPNGQTKTQAEASIEKASGDKTLYAFRAEK